MKRYLQLVILLLASFSSFQVNAQSAQWFAGTWHGSYATPTSDCFQSMVMEMRIQKIEGNFFEGEVYCAVKENSSFFIITEVAGRIYPDRMKLKTKRIVSRQDPSPCRWLNCTGCDSTILNFEIVEGSFRLGATNECASPPQCSGTTYYSRRLTDFDSASLRSLATMIASLGREDLQKEFLHIAGQILAPTLSKPELQGPLKFEPFTSFGDRAVDTQLSIVVHSDSMEVVLYDNATIDDDTITLVYNGEVVLSAHRLTSAAFVLKLSVPPNQISQLIVYAKNLGSIPPNTLFMRLLHSGSEHRLNAIADLSKSSGVLIARGSD